MSDPEHEARGETRADGTQGDEPFDPNAPTVMQESSGPAPGFSPGDLTFRDEVQTVTPERPEGDPPALAATAPTLLDESGAGPTMIEEPTGAHTGLAATAPTLLEESGGVTIAEPPPPSSGSASDVTLLEDGTRAHPSTSPSSGSGGGFNIFPSRPPGSGGSSGVRSRSALRSASASGSFGSSAEPVEGQLYAGKYELLSEIARGGMGVVYKARQVDLNRVVALKVMLSGALASDRERRRFILEAEASARLNHPHIVPVFDIGEVGGNLYFTMDFVEGQPLSERKGELTRAQLLDIMIKACDGVAYAHQRGIIHRDLKPANIMTNEALEPQIMDFGLAKQVEVVDEDGQPSLMTREGSVMGTPHYMPPEQAEGLISEIDVRSDVYALGVILYELYTGQLPFLARSISELMLCILERDPKPPRSVDPTIDIDLEAIILKAIEKPKAKRYESAADLKHDLERFRDGLPIQARRATAVYRLQKWTRRNRHRLGVGALIAAVLLLSGGFALYKSNEARLEREQARAILLADTREALGEETGRVAALEAAAKALLSEDRGELPARDERAGVLEADAAQLAGTLAKLRSPLAATNMEEDPEDAKAAGELDQGLADLSERVARVRERMRRLRRVHQLLGEARATLQEAEQLKASLLVALADQGDEGAGHARYARVQEALDGYKPLLGERVAAGGRAEASGGEADGEGAFARALGQVRKLAFGALGALGELSEGETSPEAAAGQRVLADADDLSREVLDARRRVAGMRLAGRLCDAGMALVELLDAEAAREHAARAPQPTRLEAARLAQELVQRGHEVDTEDTMASLGAAEQGANRAYAQLLLEMKAYTIFQVETADEDAFRPEDLVALRAQYDQAFANLERLRQDLEDAGQTEGRGIEALEQQRRHLAELEGDPALDEELESLRRQSLEHVGRGLQARALAEIAAQIEATRAEQNGLDATARARELKRLLGNWERVEALAARRDAYLDPVAHRGIINQARRERALLRQEAALELETTDAARSLIQAERAETEFRALHAEQLVGDEQLEAVVELVLRLRRAREKPEGMVPVEARTRLQLGGGPGDRNPSRTVDIAPFYLAVREVTCEEYEEFLGSPTYRDEGFWQRLGVDGIPAPPAGWEGLEAPAGTEELPVVGIGWHEARGYAAFRGMRLPTDDEWEYVARYEGTGTRPHPWGSWREGLLASVLRSPGANPADRSHHGVLDLGGNVSEWVVTAEGGAAARGGSFLYPYRRIASGMHRLLPDPAYRGPQLGLRLAKDSQ